MPQASDAHFVPAHHFCSCLSVFSLVDRAEPQTNLGRGVYLSLSLVSVCVSSGVARGRSELQGALFLSSFSTFFLQPCKCNVISFLVPREYSGYHATHSMTCQLEAYSSRVVLLRWGVEVGTMCEEAA